MDDSNGGAPAAVRRSSRGRRQRWATRHIGRLDAGLDEAVAQELLGVAEGQAARLRPHDDQEKALARPPRSRLTHKWPVRRLGTPTGPTQER